jgi:hypothetical protein
MELKFIGHRLDVIIFQNVKEIDRSLTQLLLESSTVITYAMAKMFYFHLRYSMMGLNLGLKEFQ